MLSSKTENDMSKDIKGISDEEIRKLQDEFSSLRSKIKILTKRIAEDTILFEWADKEAEHVSHTKAWKELVPGLWARSIDTISDVYSVVAYSSAGGVFLPKHRHPNQGQTMFIIEGEASVFIDGENTIVQENDIVIVDKNTWHSLFTLSPFGAIVKYVPRTFTEQEHTPQVVR